MASDHVHRDWQHECLVLAALVDFATQHGDGYEFWGIKCGYKNQDAFNNACDMSKAMLAEASNTDRLAAMISALARHA